jgi:hypothetical protein
MQNSSPTQMLMVLTRIGHGSKLVITGDLKQSDRSDSNGLGDFIRKLKVNCGSDGAGGFGCSPLIRFVEMNSVDVQRSQVVSSVLNLYYPTASVSVVSGSDTASASATATHVLEKNSSTVGDGGSAAGSARRDGSNDAAIIPSHLYKF